MARGRADLVERLLAEKPIAELRARVPDERMLFVYAESEAMVERLERAGLRDG